MHRAHNPCSKSLKNGIRLICKKNLLYEFRLFLLLRKRKIEKSNMANNACPYPTIDQTNLYPASTPPSYEQSQFQRKPVPQTT